MRRMPIIALLAGSFAFPGAMLWACGGTIRGPRVCSERQPCKKGRTCVLGRCRKNKTMPVSTKAPLHRFAPIDLAWANEGEVVGHNDIGDRIVLGARGHASSKLYLRFAVSIPPAERIQRALLTLTPLKRCDRRPGRMALEIAHILAPWQSSELSTATRPKLGLPIRLAEASVTPPRPLRLDVTEIVKAWSRHRKRYYGVALMAAGDSDTGACYATGLTSGNGPELSVFLWPDEPDAGAAEEQEDAAADAETDADGGS